MEQLHGVSTSSDIGMNVQGSNDNYPYAGVDGETRDQAEIERQRAESVARKAANLSWLKGGFAAAKKARALGVMAIFQADLNFNNEQKLADPRAWDAFPAYVDALRSEALAFPGQVALVHGDAHYFKLDMPVEWACRRGGVELHACRNLRGTQHALGRSHHRCRQSGRLFVRATHCRSERRLSCQQTGPSTRQQTFQFRPIRRERRSHGSSWAFSATPTYFLKLARAAIPRLPPLLRAPRTAFSGRRLRCGNASASA
jgi:hypothetical protein